jgi:hypothetical protein
MVGRSSLAAMCEEMRALWATFAKAIGDENYLASTAVQSVDEVLD